MNKMTDLDVLVELNKTVSTRIGVFVVHPVQMKNLKRFTVLSMPLFSQLLAVFENDLNIGDLIIQHEDAIVELITLCSGFTKAQYDENNFYPDDFTALVIALVEVNMDFFVQNLLPRVSEQVHSLVNKYEQIKKKIDQAKSSSSSALDMASQTSKTTH